MYMKWPDWKFTLYKREYEVYTGDSTGYDGIDWFKPYVMIELYINKHSGFHFVVSIPNRSFSGRNPFSCVMRAMRDLVKRELKLDRRLGE